MNKQTESFLRIEDVEVRIGRHRSSIYRMVKAGEFPEPIQLGARSVAWRETEINAWIEKKAEEGRIAWREKQAERKTAPRPIASTAQHPA